MEEPAASAQAEGGVLWPHCLLVASVRGSLRETRYEGCGVVESAPTRPAARGCGVVLPAVERWQREPDSRKLLWIKMGPMPPRMSGDLAVHPAGVVVHGGEDAADSQDKQRPASRSSRPRLSQRPSRDVASVGSRPRRWHPLPPVKGHCLTNLGFCQARLRLCEKLATRSPRPFRQV